MDWVGVYACLGGGGADVGQDIGYLGEEAYYFTCCGGVLGGELALCGECQYGHVDCCAGGAGGGRGWVADFGEYLHK